MHRQIITVGVFLLAASWLVGCDDGKTKAPGDVGVDGTKKVGKSKAGEGKAWDASKATATIQGVVRFVGKVPRRRPMPMGADAKCHAAHAGKKILDPSVVVNEDKTLRNVFVYVKEGVGEYSFPAPSDPVLLDQKRCIYVPHVIGAMVNQTVKFKNSDPTSHNVHVFTDFGQSVNLSQKPGASDSTTFNVEEVAVKIKCDIHSWMSAYVCVVEHPFFAVTGDGGTFSLPKLAPGEYVIEAWHERFGRRTEKVKIEDGEEKQIEFSFKK